LKCIVALLFSIHIVYLIVSVVLYSSVWSIFLWWWRKSNWFSEIWYFDFVQEII